jgi:hypothetical protein
VLVTNQSGIGRGYYGWAEFAAVQDAIRSALDAQGARLDAVYACPHHPSGRGAFAIPHHPARKPNPRLTAPVEGVVQQLAIHTIGGVVTPAQALMLIVPAETRLEIEAMISNRDIGFVEVGQDAAIKVDTFNFTGQCGSQLVPAVASRSNPLLPEGRESRAVGLIRARPPFRPRLGVEIAQRPQREVTRGREAPDIGRRALARTPVRA